MSFLEEPLKQFYIPDCTMSVSQTSPATVACLQTTRWACTLANKHIGQTTGQEQAPVQVLTALCIVILSNTSFA